MELEGVADPLADIPEREAEAPRGDPAAAIFHVMSVVRPDECGALEDLFRLYYESGRTSRLPHSPRIDSVYLGGNPVWERLKPGIIVPDGTAKIAARTPYYLGTFRSAAAAHDRREQAALELYIVSLHGTDRSIIDVHNHCYWPSGRTPKCWQVPGHYRLNAAIRWIF